MVRHGEYLSVVMLCESFLLPIPETEYRFTGLSAKRRWRFDFAWPKEKVALEIEGGAWIRGRHTRGVGFLRDMEKYNEAAILGWKLLRCTPDMVKTGAVVDLLKYAFYESSHGQKPLSSPLQEDNKGVVQRQKRDRD